MLSLMVFMLAGSAAQADLGGVLRPEVGDDAPAFSAAATTGQTLSLADYRGQKVVVLAFFPKAFTGG